MKRFVYLLAAILMVVIVTGCKEKHSLDEGALDGVELYLKFPDDEYAAQNKKGAVEYIRTMKDELSQPEKFDELANQLELGNLVRAKELYNELGGEPIAPPEKTEYEKKSEQQDKIFGVTNLHAASLYINADFNVSDEDRKHLADIIRDGVVILKDESQDKFIDLADAIEIGDIESAKPLYDELIEEYIPDDKLSEFEKMSNLTSQEDIEEAINKIIVEN